MASTFNKELDSLFETRFNVVRALPPAQLRALPEMSEEEIEVQGKKIEIVTWRENLPGGLVFVIFQFWFRRFLGNRCKTEGLIIQANGEMREATEDEWDEYGGL